MVTQRCAVVGLTHRSEPIDHPMSSEPMYEMYNAKLATSTGTASTDRCVGLVSEAVSKVNKINKGLHSMGHERLSPVNTGQHDCRKWPAFLLGT